MVIESKRGEQSLTFIVSITLSILAFLAVAFFLTSLNLKDRSSDELCKLSVLGRGTSPDAAQAALPLECTTKKVCLSSGKGSCNEVFAGEKEVDEIALPKESVKASELIAEASAQAMYDCWNMMGQGKIDIFGAFGSQFGLEPSKPSCVICSRIAVDKDVSNDVLTQVNINTYLRTHNVPGSELTYLQTFTDRSIQSYAEVDENALAQFPKTDFNVQGINSNSANNVNREMAIVFMQVKSVAISDVLTKMGTAGGIVVGSTFMTPIVRSAASRLVFTPAGAVATVVGAGGIAGFGAYNAYQGQLTATGYCGKLESRTEKSSEGCSIVQGINYNAADINSLCPSIQGDP